MILLAERGSSVQRDSCARSLVCNSMNDAKLNANSLRGRLVLSFLHRLQQSLEPLTVVTSLSSYFRFFECPR